MFGIKSQFGPGFTPPTETAFTRGADETPLTNLEIIISHGIGILTVVAAVFFIFYFLLAAFGMITAGGDSGKLNTARDKMVHATLGLVIVVAAYAAVGLIGSVVGLDILNPAEILGGLVP